MTLQAQELQLRRGTSAEDDAFTGKAGEPTWDTDTNQLRIHDGSTVGGHKVAMETALDGKLDTAGGTMTGGVIFSGTSNAINNAVSDNEIRINGGTTINDGGSLVLYGKDSEIYPDGGFILRATDGTNTYDLLGAATGILTWNGKGFECIESLDTGCIRYTSGLQICWGTVVPTGNAFAVTYPKAFAVAPYPVINYTDRANYTQFLSAYDCSTTGFKVEASNGAYPIRIGYVVIGQWS